MDEPDGALLDAARAGDETAFEDLVSRHRRELHAHCYRMLGSLQDAEVSASSGRRPGARLESLAPGSNHRPSVTD